MTEPLLAVPAVPATLPLTLVQASEQTASERAALPKLERIRVDIPTAVTIVYGAIPAILAQKTAIKENITKFQMQWIDKLEAYASAALYAHTAWQFSLAPPAFVQELIAQVTKRRGKLVSVLETVVIHELVPPDALAELQGPKGHKNIATDLIGAAEVLLNHWSVLENKVPVTRSDLEQDRELGHKLLQAIGQRDGAPAAARPLALERMRAYTLLLLAYSEVRAAVGYVRRHDGDADRISPTFFPGGRVSKRQEEEFGDEEAEADDAPVTGVVPVPPDAGAGPSSVRSAVPVGHPDSDPLGGE